MPNEKSPQKPQIKVTDKRLFTAEGEIREEFRDQVTATPSPDAAPAAAAPAAAAKPPDAPAAEAPQQQTQAKPAERRDPQRGGEPPSSGERRRSVAARAENPGTAFTDFAESIIAQAYMALGMLRNPYQPQPTVDPGAARQMIEILTMLKEKTAGNLTEEEEDFLNTHLGELKLAFVQRTKTI